jgi:ABC-2 type transport system permease protein
MKNAILDTLVITKRQLLQLARVPELLVFSTIQPVMFVLLFRYVFGGSIDTGQPGGYVQLLMPGIFVQTVAFTLASTAIGLAEDMKKGLIDRFRSLPISRGAVIIGRTFGDALLKLHWLSYSCLCLVMHCHGSESWLAFQLKKPVQFKASASWLLFR